MARPQSPPILAQLRGARTIPEQAAALRALKNDIVGHVFKKEQWISLGVLEPIVRMISPDRSTAKLNGKGSHLQFCSRRLTDEDDAKLQALQLVASFAHGGPPFLAPIHASNAVPAVLASISPYANPPQIVTTALRALTDMAAAAYLADESCPLTTHALAEQIFTPAHIDSLNAMLSISSPKQLLQNQVALTCGLIHKLCREEKHRNALAVSGVLDSLAARLASFAVADGCVIPGAEEAARNDGLLDAFPAPAPSSAKIEPVLEAIASILGDSKYRANRLVYAPATMAVFPPIRVDPSKTPSGDPACTRASDSRSNLDITVMEYVLPPVPIPSTRSNSGTPPFSSLSTPSQSEPPLLSRNNSNGKGISRFTWDDCETPQPHSPPETDPEEVESPLIPWLIHLVRSKKAGERLMAASVLAALYKADLGSKRIRETSISLLVIPPLVDMIAQGEKQKETPAIRSREKASRRTILEQAPLILAHLMVDRELLQKAAADCQAVKILTKLLRRAYTPLDAPTPPMWSPYPETDVDMEEGSPISRLGSAGQNEEALHHVKLRESTLTAIAALAAGKEDHRKAIVAEDLVPYVVQSLTEFPRKPQPPPDRSKDRNTAEAAPATTVAQEYGKNSLEVVIAACHVVRVLSRSISILRTSLVDHGVALPILSYLRHPEIDVQNAATSAIVNLVVEASPVRELLESKGVMTILCEHAHSGDPSLRLNALWALKHFVYSLSTANKQKCLEKLESGWLVQLIQDDTQDAGPSGSAAADGPDDDMDEDEDADADADADAEEMEDVPPADERHRWIYGTDGDIRELDASQSTRMRQAENKLASIRDAETNPARKARNDDVAIQEQGLDFIRNLIGRPGTGMAPDSSLETSVMIEHLFSEVGQSRLFDILASKLRPKYLHPFSRRTPVAGREARVVHPQAQLMVSVIYILVHMAASDPRHRQLVVAQTELLRLLVQNTGKDKEVRIALCHLVMNLTWQDDEGESEGCRLRVAELKKLGFQRKMEMLRVEDRELDVRERAKSAVFQMEQASSFAY